MRQVSMTDIRAMAKAAAGRIDHIYLHWSAGHYGQPFSDYHFNIDHDGSVQASVDDLAVTLAHTWRRNTGSVAVSLMCCAFASTTSLGQEPPTEAQVECMAQLVAVLCRELGLPCDYAHVMTHAEAADEDDYGPATTCERWDLWFLRDDQARGSGGHILRGKALWYMANGT